MSDYSRFISYLHYYNEAGKRVNAGHARIEVKLDVCKISIHIKQGEIPDSELDIYYYTKGQGLNDKIKTVRIGNVKVINGESASSFESSVQNINQSGISFNNVNGVLICREGNSYFITADWEEAELSVEQAGVIFNKDRNDTKSKAENVEENIEDTNEKSLSSDEAGNNKNINNSDNAVENNTKSEIIKQDISNSQEIEKIIMPERESDIKLEWISEDSIEILPYEMVQYDMLNKNNENKGIDEAENAEMDEAENIEMDEADNTEVDKAENIEMDRAENTEMDEAENTEMNRAGNIEMNKAENIEISKAENLEMDKAENIEINIAKNVEMDKAENTQINKTVYKEISRTKNIGMSKAESNEIVKGIRTVNGNEGSSDAFINVKHDAAEINNEIRSNENQKETISTTETNNMNEPRNRAEDLMRKNCYGKRMPWQDAQEAREILDNNERMYPFQDGEIAECVKIEPKDIGKLPVEFWVLGNNSFLLHSYCNYKYLLFAKRMNRIKCEYLLMVPGVYQQREKVMAKMFGFDHFKCVRCREHRIGEFGYWYMSISF